MVQNGRRDLYRLYSSGKHSRFYSCTRTVRVGVLIRSRTPRFFALWNPRQGRCAPQPVSQPFSACRASACLPASPSLCRGRTACFFATSRATHVVPGAEEEGGAAARRRRRRRLLRTEAREDDARHRRPDDDRRRRRRRRATFRPRRRRRQAAAGARRDGERRGGAGAGARQRAHRHRHAPARAWRAGPGGGRGGCRARTGR